MRVHARYLQTAMFIAGALAALSSCSREPTACQENSDCFVKEACASGTCTALTDMDLLDMEQPSDQDNPPTDQGPDPGDDGSPDEDMKLVPMCPIARPDSCFELCVDLQSDTQYCGDCATSCESGEVCDAGDCVTTGDCRQEGNNCAGQTYCDTSDGVCKPGCDSDAQCGEGYVCDTEAHTCGCASGFHECMGACSPNDSVLTCGDRCEPCEQPPNATASCDGGVACKLSCNEGFELCGNSCVACPDSPGVASTGCMGNTCVATSCSPPYTQCSDGCCAPPLLAKDSLKNVDAEEETSMAIDSAGNLHVAFYDPLQSAIGYVFTTGTSWANPEYPDGTGLLSEDVGRYAAIAVDAQNVPHILYYNISRGQLFHIHRTNGNWSMPEAIDGNPGAVGQHVSAKFDSRGVLHAVYYDSSNENLRYAFRTNGTWSAGEVIDARPKVGLSTAMAIDSRDTIHVAYRDQTNNDLRYIKTVNNAWGNSVALEESGNVGWKPSIAVDAQDHIHVTYHSYTDSSLRYIFHNGTTWSIPQNATSSGNAGLANDLGVDAQGNLHAIFYESNSDDLRYIGYNGSQWSAPVDLSTMGNVGDNPSIAIDPYGRVHAVYIDASNDEINYTNYSP